MTGVKKKTLAPTVSGRAGSVVECGESDQRLPARNGAAGRVFVPFLGLMLATLACPTPVFAAAFSANGSVWQDFYVSGPPGTPSVSPTHATFMQQYVSADINLNSRAEASQGNLKLFTLASINGMTNWDSGHVSSKANASIVEPVSPLWQSLAGYAAPIAQLTFEYELWVGGNLYTTSAGRGAAGSRAGLTYSYHVGDSAGGGDWSKESTGQALQSGIWNGVVQSSFTVQKGSTFNLQLMATAASGSTKTYDPGSSATVVAMADFSHTMIWLGITDVRAFDSLGNEVALPPGAYLPLIGQDSGFDYWYSAAASEPVPEPATGLLLGCGLAVAGLIRGSVVRRRRP